MRLPGGDVDLELRCSYSLSVPRLEVVRSVPGTLWEAAYGIHHVGYWSDDVAADVAELTGHGFVTEATRPAPGGGLHFAFLRSAATGFRVELVTRLAQPGLERVWNAGEGTGR
ncbi:hypothetical protein GCM10010468_43810 [Actinocorallia longicatena]|uniref:VOC domain-containing protein n=1 Tax=Actinocorallia longicatena TaxID=111803 RepID=A0ABP6QCD2_9ACTN